jgi:hypothetical protein
VEISGDKAPLLLFNRICFLLLEGGKKFTSCKLFLFNWINSPITPRFGSTIRSSYLLKPLNIYSYWYDWPRRYTGGAVRAKKG